MEVAPFGQFYKTPMAWKYRLIENLFLSAEGVKNLSVGYKFHLSFIIYHLQFIIKKKGQSPLVKRSKYNENKSVTLCFWALYEGL